MEMWTLFAEIWASYQTRNTPTPKDIDVIKFSLAWRMPRPVISIRLASHGSVGSESDRSDSNRFEPLLCFSEIKIIIKKSNWPKCIA